MSDRKFTVIRGGANQSIRLGSLVVFPVREKPPDLDAVVCEEDTWLLMSAPPEIRQQQGHMIRIMTDILDHLPIEPGKVMIRKGKPDELLAVVNELEETTESRAEWVEEALETIFSEAERAPYRSLALPYLGTEHGGLQPNIFLSLLRRIITATHFRTLRRLNQSLGKQLMAPAKRCNLRMSPIPYLSMQLLLREIFVHGIFKTTFLDTL